MREKSFTQHHFCQSKNGAGFTVIELLVVIALIGLLASIVLVSFNLPEKRYRATVAKSLEFSQSIQNALGMEAVGWWNFERVEAGKTPDTSANGNEGIVCDVAQDDGVKIDGGTGKALKFNGLDDMVYVSNSNPFEYRGGDLTISFWAKPALTETSGGQMVSKPWNGSGQYNYLVAYDSDRTVGVQLYGNGSWSVSTNKKLPANKWHHIGLSLSGATKNVKIYLDAELVKEVTHTIDNWTPPAGDGDVPLVTGTLYPYGCGWDGYYEGNPAYGFSFDGGLDEVRIYSQALTAQEIQQHYVEGLQRHRDLASR